MSILVLIRGLPGSGKSTLASQLISENTVTVNRDNLRFEMFQKYFGVPENLVTIEQTKRVKNALLSGKNVIVDDTNLNPSIYNSWLSLAKSVGAETQTVDMTDVSVETCIQRDLARKAKGERFVGGEVIRAMAKKWLRK